MICPICQSKLTKVKKTSYGIGYECRKKYFYLERGYPICHYIYREYKGKDYKIEHRYLFYPFVIYARPELNECQIEYLCKKNEDSHHGMTHLVNLEYFEPDCSNPAQLIEKLNLYLLFK